MPRFALLEQINVLRHQVFVVLNRHKISLFLCDLVIHCIDVRFLFQYVRLGQSSSARLIKENLRNQYSQNWLETKNSSSTTSRETFMHKEVKKSYQFENYLKTVTNSAHRISLIKLRLGCHALRIQTGKYENKGASIPVEEKHAWYVKKIV